MSRFTHLFSLIIFGFLLSLGCANEPKTSSEGETTNPTADIPKNPYLTETLENMQGIWVDAENENRTIRIDENVYREKIPGESEKVMQIEAYQNCPNYCNDERSNMSAYSCFILKKNNTAECFAILKLVDGELQFTSMAGRPKMAIFRKQQGF